MAVIEQHLSRWAQESGMVSTKGIRMQSPISKVPVELLIACNFSFDIANSALVKAARANVELEGVTLEQKRLLGLPTFSLGVLR